MEQLISACDWGKATYLIFSNNVLPLGAMVYSTESNQPHSSDTVPSNNPKNTFCI